MQIIEPIQRMVTESEPSCSQNNTSQKMNQSKNNYEIIIFYFK